MSTMRFHRIKLGNFENVKYLGLTLDVSLTLKKSPNGDQHQFSPTNIHMLPREMVMRVNKMTTKRIEA